MIVLIAESKTMTACSVAVSSGIYHQHMPRFASEANGIMASLSDMTPSDLSAAVKISPAMALKLHGMIYEFPNKSTGVEAIKAFTGVVFRAFSYASLNDREKAITADRVRIVSSLYGWLRPDDIIKAYRFDFTTPLAPGDKSFAAYWRESVTESLLQDIRQGGHRDVLDLLPADAARSIDWKRISAVANVWKADFQEPVHGDRTKTPNANKLKTLRGLLLRHIICDNICNPHDLLSLSCDQFMALGASEDGHLIFLSEK